jgi:hypothetical protein
MVYAIALGQSQARVRRVTEARLRFKHFTPRLPLKSEVHRTA